MPKPIIYFEKSSLKEISQLVSSTQKKLLEFNCKETTGENQQSLVVDDKKLGLFFYKEKKPIVIDFTSTANIMKAKTLSKAQAFVKAVKSPSKTNITGTKITEQNKFCLDLTGGYLGDSYLLAHLGYEVIACEKNTLLYLVGFDALQRAAEINLCDDIGDDIGINNAYVNKNVYVDISSKIKLHNSEANEFISQTNCNPALVYYDPMYVEKKKSLPNKKLQWLYRYLEKEAFCLDSQEKLLKSILQQFTKARVVVKRSIKSPYLGKDLCPKYSLKSKLVRFDVY